MPNWAHTTMLVMGPQESLEKFKTTVAKGDVPFQLDAVIPMPKELLVAASPGTTEVHAALYGDAEKVMDKWRKDHDPSAIERQVALYRDNPLSFTDTPTADEVAEYRKQLEREASIKTIEELREYYTSDPARNAPVEIYDGIGDITLAKTYQRNIEKYGYPTWYEWRDEHWGPTRDAVEVAFGEDEYGLRYSFKTPWVPPMPVIGKLSELFPELTIVGQVYEDMANYIGRFVGSECIFLHLGFGDPEKSNVWRELSAEDMLKEEAFINKHLAGQPEQVTKLWKYAPRIQHDE